MTAKKKRKVTKITYDEIIKKWIAHWITTYNSAGGWEKKLTAGDESGKAPFGVKIMFNGYGENDDGSEDESKWFWVVYVHKDSLTKEFKPHELYRGWVINRPKEECRVNVVRNSMGELEVGTMIDDETDDCTELDKNFVIDLIRKIYERDRAK
jgi:hypothetical protein